MTQTQEPVRSRTFSWSDPAENAAQLGRRSGLELLRAMTAGELAAPPVMHLLDMSRLTADEGRVVVELVPQEFHYNPLGSVHGGVISTLLDTAAGCAVHSTLPAGMGYTSLDLNVKFLRPVTVDSGTLRCEGTVLQRGRRTALAEARLTDTGGRLVAHATSSCLLFPVP
ncbi:PaaI family thioesterase [Micromonospora sp. URMC 103]|uniref:PaaI family thioesterase n=1 Tax=Micromonospora sp. URMC 103 TaxID=3423406 RepID=UPI003F1A4AE3